MRMELRLMCKKKEQEKEKDKKKKVLRSVKIEGDVWGIINRFSKH